MVEERLAQAEKEDGEKLTVEWRGERIHLRVISMPVDALYYNPDTHRIRAQLDLDSKRKAELSSAPWSKGAQDYLDTLLKSQPSDPDKIDPDFDALRDNLDDFGQEQPGLITRDGILVNGNTRCAALRELGVRHIRVGVLPPDTSREDVNTVELALQLRRENKRDYSYINQLIAMEEQLAAGRRPEDIAKDFHIRIKTLEQDRWVYGVIRDAIDRSQSDGDGLRLIDFEDHQEKLRELYRAYMSELATSRDAAETLLETRLAMIVLGFSKTDVRLAKPDFFDKYLAPKLDAELVPERSSGSTGGVDIPGLELTVAGTGNDAAATRALADRVLRAKATVNSKPESANEEQANLVESVKEAIDRALVPAGKDERLRQRKVAAAERLSDAADLVDLCTGDLAQAIAQQAVDEAALDDSLIRLRASLAKLGRQAARSLETAGTGIDWLRQIAEE